MMDAPRSDEAHGQLESLRQKLFSNVYASDSNEEGGVTYLDYMGSGLEPSLSALEEHLHTSMRKGRLGMEPLGNPHSGHPFGRNSHHCMDLVRKLTLQLLDAEGEYDVIFTAGCTASLTIVGTCLLRSNRHDNDDGQQLWMHRFCHNSAVGLRELTSQRRYRSFLDSSEIVSPPEGSGPHLLVVPYECNFSGHRPNLASIIEKWKSSEANHFVLVDAAAAVGKTPISLKGSTIDYFAFSFYKAFGFPTGVGALLVRKAGCAQAALLQGKQYFGGGSVEYVVPDKVGEYRRRTANFHEAMEDGTPNFQSIALLPLAFDMMKAPEVGGVAGVARRIDDIRSRCVSMLLSLKYSKGTPLIKIHRMEGDGKGSSIAFSVLESNGAYIGSALVEKLLEGCGVYVRSGCFCNPGACNYFLGLDESTIMRSVAAGHKCWDDMDMMDGKPLGCVRVSVGMFTIDRDVDRLTSALQKCFLAVCSQQPVHDEPRPRPTHDVRMRIKKIVLFPVKGCVGVAPQGSSWPVTSQGLYGDRSWMIVDAASGSVLNGKTVPAMMLLDLNVSLERNSLVITAPSMSTSLTLALFEVGCNDQCLGDDEIVYASVAADGGERQEAVRIRGAKEATAYRGYCAAVDAWLSGALGRPCRLLRRPDENTTTTTFTNTGDVLVVHEASHHKVMSVIPPSEALGIRIDAYRANLVLTGGPYTARDTSAQTPFVEHDWASMTVRSKKNGAVLECVASGPCRRCQQVNVKGDGTLGHQPLAAVSALCRQRTGSLQGADAQKSGCVFGQMFDVRVTISTKTESDVALHNQPRGTSIVLVAALACFFVGRECKAVVAAGALLLPPVVAWMWSSSSRRVLQLHVPPGATVISIGDVVDVTTVVN